ncbi:MAG: radical SAM protein [Methanoculleaceae archaeon]
MGDDLSCCNLCEWRCGVDRRAGERGVCRVGEAEVAAAMLSTTLSAVSVTLLGCCYRCLHCNAYRISQYPDPRWWYRGYVPPEELAAEARARIEESGLDINRISFTGGDPIIHIPYIEQVAASFGGSTGISTGGFATPGTMRRICRIADSITLEIKAFSDPVHRAVTGAPVDPVLRNAGFLARHARDQIRVFRTVVIPGITDGEIPAIARFIASLDETIPYRLIGFRPNNVLYYHPGPSRRMMESLTEACRKEGLLDVEWSGYYPTATVEEIGNLAGRLLDRYGGRREAAVGGAYAARLGCPTHPRDCGGCPLRDRCPAVLREPWRPYRPGKKG